MIDTIKEDFGSSFFILFMRFWALAKALPYEKFVGVGAAGTPRACGASLGFFDTAFIQQFSPVCYVNTT